MLFYFLVEMLGVDSKQWETNDWLASLAVIGCLGMEAILGDTVFSIHFIGTVISCVDIIFVLLGVSYWRGCGVKLFGWGVQ